MSGISGWAAIRDPCAWRWKSIGMPTEVKVDKRLAVFYDGPGGERWEHLRPDVGLAWLDLPLTPPAASMKIDYRRKLPC